MRRVRILAWQWHWVPWNRCNGLLLLTISSSWFKIRSLLRCYFIGFKAHLLKLSWGNLLMLLLRLHSSRRHMIKTFIHLLTTHVLSVGILISVYIHFLLLSILCIITPWAFDASLSWNACICVTSGWYLWWMHWISLLLSVMLLLWNT